MIVVKSKRCSEKNILKEYPDAVILDVTSHADGDLVRLSPFYPHGGIPVPFSPGWTAMSVESIWQGLKVFETAGVDTTLFRNIRDEAKHFHLICLSRAYMEAVSLTLTKLENVFLIHKGVLRLTGVVLVGTFQPFIKKEKSPRNCFRGRFHVKGD